MKVRKALFPIIVLFVSVNLLGFLLPGPLGSLDVKVEVLLLGNLFVSTITLFSFWMLFRGLKASSTHSFMTSVYGSFIIKLVVSALIVVSYSKKAGNDMNTPGIFVSMFLYMIYTFLEIKGLLDLSKK
jgi:hypothetical protein